MIPFPDIFGSGADHRWQLNAIQSYDCRFPKFGEGLMVAVATVCPPAEFYATSYFLSVFELFQTKPTILRKRMDHM